MAYPPFPHTERDEARVLGTVRAHPFAHFFTSGTGGQLVTQLPFAIDADEDGKITGLRAHMHAQNPQVADLDGGQALIAFSGPHSYVSPNWRVDKTRGATWDYIAVQVWGESIIRQDMNFFHTLINDLAAEAEAQFPSVSDNEPWRFEDAPTDYVERLFAYLVPFEVKVNRVQGISKLHQDFPAEDAASVAEHLSRADQPSSQEIASLIRERLDQST